VSQDDNEEAALRAVALGNASAILQARARADRELAEARQSLQARTNELVESLSLMRATLEATADGILVTAADGRIVTFNERFLTIWGLPHQAVEGANHGDLAALVGHRFRDPHNLLSRIQHIYRSPHSDELDVLEMADGRVFERFSRPQQLDGRAVGRVWSYRDVTDRRRAEEAAREEARVLDLLNRTGQAISSTLDLPKLLQQVTDTGRELSDAEFGAFFYNALGEDGGFYQLYTLSGAPREAFESFGHPRPTPIFKPTFDGEACVRVADVTQDPRYGQWSPHHGMPHGHLPVRSYMAAAVTSRNGRVLGGLLFGHSSPGVFTERSERLLRGVAAQAAIAIDNALLYEESRRVAAESERLAQAERAARSEITRASHLKDDFLATLSHELRTPLTAILGWARVLMRKRDDTETIDRGLEAIERNAVAQAQLIDDLLDMSRIMSGKVRLDVRPTDLAQVVDAAIESVRPSADAKDVRLVSVLDPRAGPVPADPARLQQVVWNLLTNAIKFTPKGGRVEAVLRRVNSHLELTVVDNGVGIAPEFMPHVFDRFRQADSSTTRSHGGLGLGLSIVKQLVEMHGGTVHAYSEGRDRGATFTVCVPLSAVRPQPHEVHPTADSASPGIDVSLDGMHVLVVDDEPDTRELLSHLLTDCHAHVHTARSAREGMEALQRLKPDALISDIGMPEQDGYQFIRAVRGLPADRGGRTPAIALTAFARSEDRTRAMLAGYQLHIAKPIEPHELLAALASLVGRMPQLPH
jgi:PAS domain S-box-containing protein